VHFTTAPERSPKMILFIVLAVLLPWSLYRQMQENPVSRGSLLKLPLIFVGIGLLVQSGPLVPSGSGVAVALTISVAASVLLGIWRGAAIPVWTTRDGTWMSKGNRLTITLWIALVALKFLLGTVGSITGWFPVETITEIFITLGLSFAVQNYVVARRTINQPLPAHRATA
jgi:hypothetical protein